MNESAGSLLSLQLGCVCIILFGIWWRVGQIRDALKGKKP